MRHAFIPDTQLKKGVKTNHIIAAGNWIAAHFKAGDRVIIAGDWWDLPSLSSYDKPGDRGWEEKNLDDDINFPNEVMADLFNCFSKKQLKEINFYFTEGNHENRLTRAQDAAQSRIYGSVLSHNRLNLEKCRFVPFLHKLKLDGVMYSHYFTDPNKHSDRPLGGSIKNRLQKLCCSFVMGHQQEHALIKCRQAMTAGYTDLFLGSFISMTKITEARRKTKNGPGLIS